MVQRVVIVGAGFGGLECAKELARQPVDVLLVDRNNYHLFTPLLYQVASSLLNPSDIARPVRALFRGADNVRFRQAEVTGVDVTRRAVRLADGGELAYDTLVLASGSATFDFGVAGVAEHALGLKDLPEAIELRNHILSSLETAAEEPAASGPHLTFVVAGAGPTGVEYAGALAELVRLVLPREYPELGERRARIVLVEGEAEVLPPFPPALGRAARRALEKKGVEVRTGVRVRAVESGRVTLSDGETIATSTLVWAAGVRAGALAGAVGAPRSRTGRLRVDPFLRLEGHPEIFAIGDVASVTQDGGEVPMLSAPAMQEGRAAAANLLRALRGAPLEPFHYRDKGSMATIGRNAAVATLGPLRLTGFVGWVIWLAVHLYYIIGFRNRIAVLLGWAWNYLRSDRPIRIIARARER